MGRDVLAVQCAGRHVMVRLPARSREPMESQGTLTPRYAATLEAVVERKTNNRIMSKETNGQGQESLASASGSAAVIVAEGYYRLKEENERLKEWIREEGIRTDTCTYDILGEICEGCMCKRQPQQNDKISDERL